MPDGDPTEIHSENGYIAVEYDKEQEKEYVSLNTAMSNGRKCDIILKQCHVVLNYRIHDNRGRRIWTESSEV